MFLFSCQKLEYNDDFTPLREVFLDYSGATALNGQSIVNYKGFPLAFYPFSGSIYRSRLPEGEAKLQFYHTQSPENLLAEKTITISSDIPDTLILFQPTANSSVAIFNSRDQDNEEAAPEGYLKIKIANYAKKALPYDKIDVRVETYNSSTGFEAIDTIRSVGKNLEEAKFQLVKKGKDILGYRFSYLIPDTDKEILNARGTLYTNGGIWSYPNIQKDVLTMFLTESFEADLATASNAAKGRGVIVDDKYIYRISPNILFKY